MSYAERRQDMFGLTGEGPAKRLASAEASAPGAAGTGTLKHSKGPWTGASGTAADLRTRTETSRSALRRGHEGVDAGAAGLSSVAALKQVLTSWEDRLQSVRDECEHLEGALLAVAKEMGETEAAVEKSFRGVRVPSHADEKR
ncbi:hypothetical protein GTY40_11875 [Streptomyces sp. SID8359]|uniref:hypothetical protein n=1 Tax=unclassified Streptomyces TaxID=2593676 RepID=UPI00048E1454|nr:MULTISPECIES: hypothetical protein [unclassified Streptomyces]MYT91746.1 hypothetical protein [Streptomyces sp. SID8359]